jgi:ABC-type transport system involved in cytochrome c biogenesis permease subunit
MSCDSGRIWHTWLASIFALVLSFASDAAAVAAVDLAPIRSLPVLDRGRVKPLDTLARETVRLITGKESFGVVKADDDGQHVSERLDPLVLLLAWQREPELWDDRPLLYVPNIELRKRVGLPESSQWISPAALRKQKIFASSVMGLMQKQQQAEQSRELSRLTPADDAAILLWHRLATYEAATSGRLIGVLPHKGDSHAAWGDLESIASDPGSHEQGANIVAAWHEVLQGATTNNQLSINRGAAALESAIAPLRVAANVDTTATALEVKYNLLRPFRIVWISYFLVVVLFALAGVIGRTWPRKIALIAMAGCIALHVAAFVVRCRITGWAPVTNMYETVVWVSLVSAVLALIVQLFSKSTSTTMAVGGTVTALVASIVADVMPPEMGRSIGPLAPVLRSNYWLSIHVLTIVSSYAAFALACVLGNIAVYRFARGQPYGGSDALKAAATRVVALIYRSVQVGVLLIAAGTILGGLWADVSWGRFWGWDPKEVWALIVLLTYLALLHGRFAGRLGPFGFSAWSVICFTTVLMSWYGVNFVLGAGLHSYGFGVGGQGFVASYILLQVAYVIVAWRLQRRHLRARNDRRADAAAVPAPEPNPVGAVPIFNRSATS